MDQPSAEAAINDLFSPLGIEVASVSKLIAPHESKKDQPGDHHYLFVELSRAEDLEPGIDALDGKPSGLGGEGTLRVNKAREQQSRGGYGQRREGYQPRRNEGGRDWRRGNEGQENGQ